MAKIKYRVGGGCQCCLTCIYECPVQAITVIGDVSAQIDPAKCIGCGSCCNACQAGAIEPYEEEET